MDNWFQSKWFIRVLALAFAVTLFIFVNVETNSSGADSSIPGRNIQTQRLDDVPVEIKIDSENYVVSGVPEFATVTLEGSPATIMPAIFNRNFSVFVDLRGLEEGNHPVELQHTLSDDIRVYIEPKSIDVTIEERATEEFPIAVEFLNTDDLPQGYEVGKYELEQSSVTITTSRRIMEQIGVVKIYVDVGGVDSPIRNREVPINVYDTQGNEMNVRLDRESVVVSVDLVNPSKVVPIKVERTGELPENFSSLSVSANLEEVEIYAVSEVLEGIDSISTEEIDLSQITESGTIEVGFDLPEGVSTGEVETLEVTIQVEETRVIEAIGIEEEDLSDGQDITFIEPENAQMDIKVTGNEALMRELNPDDIRVVVNVDGLEPGEHTVPVTIDWDADESLTVTPEYEEVTIEIE
ncbi:YbbR-like domain-containing protein [Oceanobacillus luteolus]|uniref:YbbR-like domain-containing protein n=1 Tax=Oceanobacillus luteolus TaxID=1274358 RepID=A0ABW4HN26_9BACI